MQDLLEEGLVTVNEGGFYFNGITPLIAAVFLHDMVTPALDELIKSGADVNAREVSPQVQGEDETSGRG